MAKFNDLDYFEEGFTIISLDIFFDKILFQFKNEWRFSG